LKHIYSSVSLPDYSFLSARNILNQLLYLVMLGNPFVALNCLGFPITSLILLPNTLLPVPF